MRALVLDAPGDPPEIEVRDIAEPSPGPHDVLVEVAACGLCGHDVAVMQGILRRGVKPGIVLGHEIAGRVAHVGGEVDSVHVGDSVVSTLTVSCGSCARCLLGNEYRCLRGRGIGHAVDGGFAQFVCLPATSVVVVPNDIEPRHACLLACPIGASLRAVRDVAAVRSDESVLVTGAGGGLGVHCVQIAASQGARVFAVTTSAEKTEPLENLTRCEVILAQELDPSEIVLAMTDDAGVDVVVETVGSAMFDSSVRSLAQFGRMALLGEVTAKATQVNLSEVLFRDVTIRASTGAGRHHIEEAVQAVVSGLIKPVVSQTYTLDEAAEAYRLMTTRKSFGRVVLVPG